MMREFTILTVCCLFACGHAAALEEAPSPAGTGGPVDEAAASAEQVDGEEAADIAEAADAAELEPTMHQYLWRLTDARDLVIAGLSDSARSSLAEIIEGPPPEALPIGSEVHVPLLLAHIERASVAEDTEGVAWGIGRAATECGSCHWDTGGGPGQTFAEDDSSAEVHPHLWASDRMWEGLIAPSQRRWSAGVEAFLGDEAIAGHRSELALGGAASPIDIAGYRDDARVDFYAEVIASCAGCHDATEAWH